jgi:hypothetical protein
MVEVEGGCTRNTQQGRVTGTQRGTRGAERRAPSHRRHRGAPCSRCAGRSSSSYLSGHRRSSTGAVRRGRCLRGTNPRRTPTRYPGGTSERRRGPEPRPATPGDPRSGHTHEGPTLLAQVRVPGEARAPWAHGPALRAAHRSLLTLPKDCSPIAPARASSSCRKASTPCTAGNS